MITIMVDDETGRELAALEKWLRDDGDVPHSTIARVESRAESGDMGLIVDTLQVISDNRDVLVASISAVGTWLATRKVTLRVRRGNEEIEISGAGSNDADEIVSELLEVLGEGRDGDNSIE